VVGNVVGHIEIEPAVVIEVVPERAETAAFGVLHFELRRNFSERAVAVVVEKQVRSAGIGSRVEREGNKRSWLPLAARDVGLVLDVLNVAADVKIEMPVIVVVGPR